MLLIGGSRQPAMPIGLAVAALLALWPAVAVAQSSPSDFTYATRYDAMHRVTGTISPDPDGSGSIRYAATRTTYDAAGRPIRIEKGQLTDWQSESVAPSAWPTWNGSSGFQVFSQVDTTYDALDRKLTETASSAGTAYTLTQYSYDSLGRLDCTAVRMNPAAWTSLPSSACTQGTAGSFGADRITRNVYDAAGQLLKMQKAYATSLQQDYETYTYSANGKPLTIKDADGNKAGYTYDGFDRLVQWNFPSPTATGTVSSTDYEAYTYDPNGNRLSLRKRDGNVIAYTYDALNRMTVKDIPGGTATDVYYGYDLRNLQTFARFGSTSGAGLTDTYDGFGRLASTSTNQSGTARTLSYSYDADGNRTSMTFPDGVSFQYVNDGLDRFNYILLAGSGYQAGLNYLAQGTVGQRALSFSHAATYLTYDGVDRLTTLNNAFNANGGANDVTATFAYNPASQIVTGTRNNNAYAFTGYVNVSRSYAANGLNQYTTAGPATFTYDANGNLTGDGTSTYAYDVENRLVSRSGGLALTYDPNGRLWQTAGGTSGTTQYLYDGDQLVAEYDGSGNVLRRYLHGPGDDDPMVWFEGAGVTSATKRSLSADERGSIIAVADDSGSPLAKNVYDEYGIPGAANLGRFQYTGQAWLPDLGMYYYKARIYSPTFGRFLQTDPIGYTDQNNLYTYVGNDPVNKIDPTGESMRLSDTFDEGLASDGFGSEDAPNRSLTTPAVEKFYSDLANKGDKYAALDLQFGQDNPQDAGVSTSQNILMAGLLNKQGEPENRGELRGDCYCRMPAYSDRQKLAAIAEYREIRVELARAYAEWIRANPKAKISGGQIYDIHKVVFDRHKLSMTRWGPTLFTGARIIARGVLATQGF